MDSVDKRDLLFKHQYTRLANEFSTFGSQPISWAYAISLGTADRGKAFSATKEIVIASACVFRSKKLTRGCAFFTTRPEHCEESWTFKGATYGKLQTSSALAEPETNGIKYYTKMRLFWNLTITWSCNRACQMFIIKSFFAWIQISTFENLISREVPPGSQMEVVPNILNQCIQVKYLYVTSQGHHCTANAQSPKRHQCISCTNADLCLRDLK